MGMPVAVPEAVRLAMDDIAGAMREGLLALTVGAGLGVMGALFEESVISLAGPKGRHDPDRWAVRHDSEEALSCSVAGKCRCAGLGYGPRMAAAEMKIAAYELFASIDHLGEMAMARTLGLVVDPPLRHGS